MKRQAYEAEISKLYWMAVEQGSVELAFTILTEKADVIAAKPAEEEMMRETVSTD